MLNGVASYNDPPLFHSPHPETNKQKPRWSCRPTSSSSRSPARSVSVVDKLYRRSLEALYRETPSIVRSERRKNRHRYQFTNQVKGGTDASNFGQTGQTLAWTGFDLNRKGAALSLKLKVKFTACADGRLEMNAFTTVGGLCLATANPAYAHVEHKKGWTPCPP